jgi:hypothetical protein
MTVAWFSILGNEIADGCKQGPEKIPQNEHAGRFTVYRIAH